MPPLIYLVLVHTAPERIGRLVERLTGPDAYIYIHVDARVDVRPFAAYTSHRVVCIAERYPSTWGDFNFTRAILALVRHALARHPGGMCILLSGSDYPIRPTPQIHAFFDRHRDQNFVDLNDAAKMWTLFRYRRDFYKVNFSDRPGDYALLKGLGPRTMYYLARGKLPVARFKHIAFTRKRLRPPLHFYGGSTWWAMNVQTLQKVFAFVDAHREDLFDFFSVSLSSDEFFFHTLLVHLQSLHPDIQVRDTVTYVNWNYRKTRARDLLTGKVGLWSYLKNYAHPKTFTEQDLPELLQQPAHKLFARKFAFTPEGDRLLDRLDALLA